MQPPLRRHSGFQGFTLRMQESFQFCTHGSLAALPLFPNSACSAAYMCLHIFLQEVYFHAQDEESLARFLQISVFLWEASLQRSKEDSTAVNILLRDNQRPSRSTVPTQLYNSLCSLEGTAPYVQFPSYI